MICKYCQAQIEDDALQCPECGKDLTDDSAENTVAAVQSDAAEPAAVEMNEEANSEEAVSEEVLLEEASAEEETEQETGKRKKTTRIIAWVCSIVLILGLGIGVWFGISAANSFGKDDILVKKHYSAAADRALKSADKVVAKVGDKTLTNRQLQVFYWMEVLNFVQNNQYYLSYFGLDPTQPLDAQYVTEGGLTWEQYFLDNALNNWHYYQCLVIEAEKNGHVISPELQKNVDDMFASLESSILMYGFSSVDEMLQQDMGAIATTEAYRHYVTLYYGGMEYFADLYTKIRPTDAEAEEYYNVHGAEVEETYGVNKESGPLVDVRHILISVGTTGKDENGAAISTEEDWDKCLSDAERILATWKEGEASEDSFALMANTFSQDPGSNTVGGLYSYVYEGQMVPAFNDWCFDKNRQPGDTGIVRTDFGYHVIYFVKGGPGWLRRSEQALVEATCTEMLAKLMEEHILRVNYSNIVLSNFSLF